MAQLPDKKLFKRALELADAGKSPTAISNEISVPRTTVRSWISNRVVLATKLDAGNVGAGPAREDILADKVRLLELQIKHMKKDTLTDHFVKTEIIGLRDAFANESANIPKWMLEPHSKTTSFPGVPTLFASDWHWWEVVDSSQIGGANEYSVEIGHDRARKLIGYTIDLLNNHMVNPNYPGIVFALGGDMVSGDIHDELIATNAGEIMPCVVDLVTVLIWCIATLADKFGNVFVPCVTGNHGRNTHKIRAKGRNYTSYDWLTYQWLAKHFENDKRIQFYIPNGSDALYSIYNRRYLLTHGDQFRGGDGMIGALGPIIRGDHKKRSRNSQIDMEYDTMLCGHWHQLIQLQRLIVNGSLKGYDEYASQGNFPYEPPRQALWLTHPKWGITFSVPVQVEAPKEWPQTSWVSWKA